MVELYALVPGSTDRRRPLPRTRVQRLQAAAEGLVDALDATLEVQLAPLRAPKPDKSERRDRRVVGMRHTQLLRHPDGLAFFAALQDKHGRTSVSKPPLWVPALRVTRTPPGTRLYVEYEHPLRTLTPQLDPSEIVEDPMRVHDRLGTTLHAMLQDGEDPDSPALQNALAQHARCLPSRYPTTGVSVFVPRQWTFALALVWLVQLSLCVFLAFLLVSSFITYWPSGNALLPSYFVQILLIQTLAVEVRWGLWLMVLWLVRRCTLLVCCLSGGRAARPRGAAPPSGSGGEPRSSCGAPGPVDSKAAASSAPSHSLSLSMPVAAAATAATLHDRSASLPPPADAPDATLTVPCGAEAASASNASRRSRFHRQSSQGVLLSSGDDMRLRLSGVRFEDRAHEGAPEAKSASSLEASPRFQAQQASGKQPRVGRGGSSSVVLRKAGTSGGSVELQGEQGRAPAESTGGRPPSHLARAGSARGDFLETVQADKAENTNKDRPSRRSFGQAERRRAAERLQAKQRSRKQRDVSLVVAMGARRWSSRSKSSGSSGTVAEEQAPRPPVHRDASWKGTGMGARL